MRNQPMHITSRHAQRGVSLFVVLIILLLSLLLVLGSLRLAFFNESIVGNQSDALRANAAAESLVEAAQRDIDTQSRGCTGGAACRYPPDEDINTYWDRQAPLENICGTGGAGMPLGVCYPTTPDEANFQVGMVMNGGAQVMATAAARDIGGTQGFAGSGADQVDLRLTPARGQYWVEVYRYAPDVAIGLSPDVARPDPSYPYIFRITARAEGIKSSTVSILRTYYVPFPADNSQAAAPPS